jgi:hypothetical protein
MFQNASNECYINALKYGQVQHNLTLNGLTHIDKHSHLKVHTHTHTHTLILLHPEVKST